MIKKSIAIFVVIILAFSLLSVSNVMAEDFNEATIEKIDTGNWGSYESATLWLNIGASFFNADDSQKVIFYITNQENGTEETAISDYQLETIAGDVPKVGSDLRVSKKETGFLIKNLNAGTYYVAAKLESNQPVYKYRKFIVYKTAKEYCKAALDRMILHYRDNWFVHCDTKEYLGLGGDTSSDTGLDWEAWIFPSLGDNYQLENGEIIDLSINGSFLSSESGKTYLDYKEELLSGKVFTGSNKDAFRAVAAICAMGGNPRDFAGINFVEDLCSKLYYASGRPRINANGALEPSGSFDFYSTTYLLLALEVANANEEEGYTQKIREAGLQAIKETIDAQRENLTHSPDSYSMWLLPVQFMKDLDGSEEIVKALFDGLDDTMSTYYLYDNGALAYGHAPADTHKYYMPNVNSAAMLLNALVASGRTADDLEDERWQRRYGSLLTAVIGCLTDEGGALYGFNENRMANYQLLGALVDIYNEESCFVRIHDKYLEKYSQYKSTIKHIEKIPEQTWTGKEIKPYLKVTDRGSILQEGIDYSVEYLNNVDEGTATVLVKGIGNYQGQQTATFDIVKKADYKETSKNVFISLSSDGNFLISNDDEQTILASIPFTVSYFDLDEYGLGSYSLKDANGNVIEQPTMLHLYIQLIEKYYLNGEKLVVGETKLEDSEYAALKITGSPGSLYMKNFWGHDENLVYFHNYRYPLKADGVGATADQILLEDRDSVELAMYQDWSFYTNQNSGFLYFADYQGNPVYELEDYKDSLSLYRASSDMNGGQSLTRITGKLYHCAEKDINSQVSTWEYLTTTNEDGSFYLNNLKKGSYYIGVPGTSVCAPAICKIVCTADSPEETVKPTDDKGQAYVNRPLNKITASSLVKEYSTYKKTYIINAKVLGGAKLSYSSSSSKVKVSSKGVITVPAKYVGKATITIKAADTDQYKSVSKTITISVNPRPTSIVSVKNTATGKMTVKWKRNSAVTGYQLQYSTSSSFKSGNRTLSIRSNKTLSKPVKSLKKKKTYYVRIRTYKKVGTTKYYSKWSSKKSVKIKR